MNELLVHHQDHVATIVFNRPKKKNALTLDMFVRLAHILDELEQDPEVFVLVIRGTDGVAFSTGADISEFMSNRASRDAAKAYNDRALEAVDRLQRFSKPTIALIHTYAIGGGLDIALACDFRFSTDDARFAITPSRLGIVYNLASVKRLTDLVGPSKAKDILYTGRLLGAEEALRIGLIDRLYPSDQIERETYAYAALIAQRSQVSVRGTKAIIRELSLGAVEESEAIAEMILNSYESDDYREGVQAFLEKRQPDFARNIRGKDASSHESP